MKVYSVTVGLHGYLPNFFAWVSTLDEAQAIAKEEKSAFLDYGWQAEDPPTVRVLGDIRRDWGYDVLRKNYLGEWDSWQYIDIDKLSITEEEWSEYEESWL